MSTENTIKDKFQRIEKALSLKPELGQHTYVSKTTIGQNLSCEITEGPWMLTVDMPESAGGKGAAPTPGVLGRAALGSCLAIGYSLWAIRHQVPLRIVEVKVEADDDDGGLFGTTQGSPGYSEVRYLVKVETELSSAEVTRLLNEWDTRSPWLDNYSRAIPTQKVIEIVSQKPESLGS